MERDTLEKHEVSNFRNYLSQWMAVGSLGVLLAGFGTSLGFPTILIPSLSGNGTEESIKLDNEGISWISSINLICVPIGCIFSGSITSWIGRKKTMLLVNIPFAIAWLLFYFSTNEKQVYAALCITGTAGGLLEAPSTTYLAEVALPKIRGTLSAVITASVTFGVLFCIFLGTFLSWRNVALINLMIPIITFICTLFVPESPYWLISKNRLNDAKKALAWVRGWTSLSNVDDEFSELCRVLNKSIHPGYDNPGFAQPKEETFRSNEVSIIKNKVKSYKSIPESMKNNIKLYTQKSFLWPYSTIVITFFFGNFCGSTSLQTYAVGLFAALRSPISAYYATNLVGLVQLLGSTFNAVFVNMLGKRMINFISLLGGAICFCVVGTYAYLNGIYDLEVDDSPLNGSYSARWVPVIFLVASAFLSFIGIKVLSWTLVGETFSNETRSVGSGLSAAAAYILSFIVNRYYLDMIRTMTLPGILWFYAGAGLIGFLVLYFILPETEGKTLYDIEQHYAGRTRLTNKVGRDTSKSVNKRKSDVEDNEKIKSLDTKL